jgi:site-specific recombinase XerC
MSRLPLKFVHVFRDRHGHLRHYFRKGTRRIPLPGLVGSEEFMAAYAAALNTNVAPELGADRTKPGTVGALVVRYYQSAEWNDLKHNTRKCRKGIIERFREQHGGKQVATLERHHIEQMMAQITLPHQRRRWLITIKLLLASAIPTMRRDNPAVGIAGVKIAKTRGYHTWEDHEIAQYRAHWPLGTQERLVMEFALEAVSRRVEVLRLGPQHVRNGRIRIERVKGSREVDIPLTPELAAAIDAMPKVHLTFIVSQWGKPYTADALGKLFGRWATEAGLPKRCRLHGLKKGGMRRLAESGGTAHELMAISGHKTLAEVQRYTEEADRKKLADSGTRKRTENAELANLGAPKWQTSS